MHHHMAFRYVDRNLLYSSAWVDDPFKLPTEFYLAGVRHITTRYRNSMTDPIQNPRDGYSPEPWYRYSRIKQLDGLTVRRYLTSPWSLADRSTDSKVHGVNMGPIWGRQDPGGPHVGPMNFAIWVLIPHVGPQKVTVMSWMNDSHPFCTMSISPPIPEICIFQNSTAKFRGQGYVCGQRSRSHCWLGNQLVYFLFRFTSIGSAIPVIQLFQNFTVKIQSESWPRSKLMATFEA